jgi:hypothetical protein
MRVRCVFDYFTPEQRAALGRRPSQGTLEAGLIIGREYLVLGLSFVTDPEHLNTGPYVTILHEIYGPRSHDLGVFEITDPRVSRYWETRTYRIADGRQFVDLLPPYLHDVLTLRDDDNDTRLGEERDDEYFAALASEEYAHTVALLREEFTLERES